MVEHLQLTSWDSRSAEEIISYTGAGVLKFENSLKIAVLAKQASLGCIHCCTIAPLSESVPKLPDSITIMLTTIQLETVHLPEP